MREHYSLCVPLSVRWGDMDALGHVNNARFFTYFEQARIEFFERHHFSRYWGPEQGPILASADCQYKVPIVYPAELEVAVALRTLGRSSFTIEHAVFRQGEQQLLAIGKTGVVWVNYKTGKAQPIPEDLREEMAKVLQMEPDQALGP